MKKLIIPVLYILPILFAGCRKNMTDLNKDPKAATDVQGEMLFTGGQINYADAITTVDYNSNIFAFVAQYWAATTYTQESRYDLGNRNVPQNFWQTFYRDVLMNYDRGIKLMSAAPALTEDDQVIKKNKLAIASINKVQAFAVMLNTFGNIPYTEAFNIDETATPKYDDQKTVYYALLDSLNKALGDLDESAESFGSQDLIYGGNVAKWIKFGNSLKLRMALLIDDVDHAKATALVVAAAPHVFTSAADNAVFRYREEPPNTNPIWDNLVQSNRNDFVPANTIVNMMNSLEDPRRPFYFTLYNDGYRGGIYGNGNSFGEFSHVADEIQVPNFPADILSYAEVEFLLAEAVERGMAVGGTAAEHYNKAVAASIAEWGGTETEAAAYLANPKVAYATAEGTWKQKIGNQAWIALYLRGYDAWISWRKLGFPALKKPNLAVTDIPVRFTYPSAEQNLNEANYKQASEAIGGDEVTTKLFWDK